MVPAVRPTATLLLLAAALSVAATTAATPQQLPAVPGLTTAAGTQGSLFLRGFDPMLGSARAPVLDFTYTNQNGDNNQWYDPEAQKTFRVPDQVVVESLPSSTTSLDTELFDSVEEWEKYASSKSWSSFDIIVVSYSHAEMNGYIKQVLNDNTSAVVQSQWVNTNHKLSSSWNPLIIKHELQFGSQVNSTFARDQAALPASRTSDADKAAYDAFLARYGTHWVHDSVYGGLVHALVKTDKSLIKSQGSKWAQEQSSFGMWLVYVSFGFASGHSSAYKSISKKFAGSSEMVIVGVGGDTGLIEAGDFGNWSRTTYLDPAPVTTSYQPISDLIYDATKATLYAQHVQEYLTTKPGTPANKTVCATDLGTTLQFDQLPHGAGVVLDVDRLAATGELVPHPAAAPARTRTRSSSSSSNPLAAAAAGAHAVSSTGDLPGLQSGIGLGYNVKTGEFGDAVAAFSYNDGQEYYNPFTGTTFRIPDGITVENVPSACFLENEWMITSDASFDEFMASNTGFSIGLSYDGFSLGVSFAKELQAARNVTDNWSKGMSLLNRWQSLYKLSYDGNPTHMSSAFTAFINSLPATESPLYALAIQYFGTHVVTSIEAGGACTFNVTYAQSYVRKTSYKNVGVGGRVCVQVGVVASPDALSRSFRFRCFVMLCLGCCFFVPQTQEQIGLTFGFMLHGIGINFGIGLGFENMCVFLRGAVCVLVPFLGGCLTALHAHV